MSTNEGLDASKERLRSLNEELAAVNSQLQDKVEKLDAALGELTNLIAATDIATLLLDTELRIKRFTPPTGRLLNLHASDAGRPFREFAPRFADNGLLRDAESVIETRTPIDKEILTDEHRWYLRRILPYQSQDKQLEGIVLTFVDITERRKAEEEIRRLNNELEQRVADRTSALAASEQRIRAVLGATVDAIITIDTQGRIETFNTAAESMFGYSAAEVGGKNVSILVGAPHHERHDEYLRRYLETREPRLIGRLRELKGRRKDGTEFPIQLSISEITELGVFTGVVRDVTEQRALQEQIVRIATAEQHRIGQELHDSTQQELTGLGLLAQNLVEALSDSKLAGQQRLAAKIAAGIAETNLNVRRLAKGLVPVPVDAHGLMVALRDLAERTEKDYGIQCRFVCPSPVQISDDNTALHLYRIVQEAVTNAVKHANADTVSIHLQRRPGSYTIRVRDNGVGIDRRPRKADGLGLRIMEHRCVLIGGTFSVKRRKSGGTIVKCEVPTAPVE